MNEVDEGLSRQIVRCPPERCLPGRVDSAEAAVDIGDGEQLAGEREEPMDDPLVLPAYRLGHFAFNPRALDGGGHNLLSTRRVEAR